VKDHGELYDGKAEGDGDSSVPAYKRISIMDSDNSQRDRGEWF